MSPFKGLTSQSESDSKKTKSNPKSEVNIGISEVTQTRLDSFSIDCSQDRDIDLEDLKTKFQTKGPEVFDVCRKTDENQTQESDGDMESEETTKTNEEKPSKGSKSSSNASLSGSKKTGVKYTFYVLRWLVSLTM